MNFTPLNRSWLLGYINSIFDIDILDFYLTGENIFKNINLDRRYIVYVDDELFFSDISLDTFFNMISDSLKQNSIFIVKVKEIYQILLDNNFRCIFVPYFHVIDEFMPLQWLKAPVYKKSSVPFASLNRRWTLDRRELIECLITENLLDKGFVTAQIGYNGIFDDHIYKLFRNDQLTHYTANGVGFERHNHKINGIPVSSNLNNSYYIAENIPGDILIQVETDYVAFPTEKSFLSFVTYKIPLIFAKWDIISDLRSEGFDMFDDLIDHNGDMQTVIHNNKKILSSQTDENIDGRLMDNYNFFVDVWINKKRDELIDNIRSLIN